MFIIEIRENGLQKEEHKRASNPITQKETLLALGYLQNFPCECEIYISNFKEYDLTVHSGCNYHTVNIHLHH